MWGHAHDEKQYKKQFSNKSLFFKHNKCDIAWFDVCVGKHAHLETAHTWLL